MFQDASGPLTKGLGIFCDGVLIAAAPDDPQQARELRNQLNTRYPGCEVLALCNTCDGVAAADCLRCLPLD